MTATEKHLPGHVPAERVIEVDKSMLPGADRDPQVAWTAFGQLADYRAVYSPHTGGHWVVTEPADIARFLRDTTNFSSRNVSLPKHPGPRFIPLEIDPPEHTQYRANILPLLTAKRIKDIQPNIRRLAGKLIDDLLAEGRCEFVTQLAIPFTVEVFLNLMGLPVSDTRYLNRLVNMLVSGQTAEMRGAAIEEMLQYLSLHIEKRMHDPKDDAISSVIQAKFDGRPYTDDEIKYTVALMTFGGVDSVAMFLSFAICHMAENPADQQPVRDRLDRLEPVINEFARRYAPTTRMRELANDVEYDGIVMQQGDMVLLPVSLYNLNEQLFPEPEHVNFERGSGKPILTFGTGAHVCPGAQLARLEVQIFLQEWFKRIAEFKVSSGTAVRKRAATINAIDELQLAWTSR